jgi:secreted PhoX family phosphatase
MAKPLFVACSSKEEEGGGTGGTAAFDSGIPPLVSNIAAIGALGIADANGVRLAPGFTARIVARTGEKPVPASEYEWHSSPDGGATYATPDGGYIYVSNSELPFAGGVGALRFDAEGTAIEAYAIATGTNVNCAGGKTPWGTWLTCEEVDKGLVFECDPTGKKAAVAYPALGVFKHEAAAIDPVNNHVYLTEDQSDGMFYRFVPTSVKSGRIDFSAGKLQVAQVAADKKVTWHDLSDPKYEGSTPTRSQVPEATQFKGGEGIAHYQGVMYFSTKGDGRVWEYHIADETMDVLYDAEALTNPVLSGVDNVIVTCCGDVLVAEDGGDMQVVAILPDGTLKPLLQVEGHDGSEITGIAFAPDGTKLYFSSQRGVGGNTGGVTYEVSGPFHLPA